MSVMSLGCKKTVIRLLLLLFMFLFLLLVWSLQKSVPFHGYFHNTLRNSEDLPLDLLREQNLTQVPGTTVTGVEPGAAQELHTDG